MDNQTVFNLVFLFLLQSALVSLRYFYYDHVEVNWIALPSSAYWNNNNNHNGLENHRNSNFFPSKDIVGNWILLFLPIFTYYILYSIIGSFQISTSTSTSSPKSSSLLDEVAFQITLLSLIHPIQLHSFLLPTIHMRLLSIGVIFLLIKISPFFQEFSLFNFSLFSIILTTISAHAVQLFLLGNVVGYSVGLVMLLNIVIQGYFYHYDRSLLIWASVLLLGTSTIGGLHGFTSTFEKCLNFILSLIHFSNLKLIDIVFPFLRSDAAKFRVVSGYESCKKLMSLLGLRETLRSSELLSSPAAYSFRTILSDILNNPAFYFSLATLLLLLYHYIWRVVASLLKWNHSARWNVWFNSYIIFVLSNLPNVVLAFQERSKQSTYNYYDTSTLLILLVLGFAFADSTEVIHKPSVSDIHEPSPTTTEAAAAAATVIIPVDKSGWSRQKRNQLFFVFLFGSVSIFLLQFSATRIELK